MAITLKERCALGGVSLFTIGAALGVAIASQLWRAPQLVVARGAALVSLAPEEIMSVSYTTLGGAVVAQRSAPGAQFAMQATFADGRSLQQCATSGDLAGHLGRFASLTAKRALSRDDREREFPIQLGVLDVRDRILGEPNGPILVFTNLQRTAIAVILDSYAAEVQLPESELAWLERGCAAVGAKMGKF